MRRSKSVPRVVTNAQRRDNTLKFITIAMLGIAVISCKAQTEFYVSPSGSPSGNGSATAPWDLATALSHPASVKPGARIWLREGIYNGMFTSNLRGTAAAPIVVRQYPNERAIIDGGSNDGTILQVGGAYTWYWGFEIRSSQPNRALNPDGTLKRGVGVSTVQEPGAAVGTKFINLVVHDTALAFGVWKEAVGAEVYGNIIFNNGWEMTGGGHGHAIYAQNQTGTMRLVDNVMFNQFSHGLHIYGSENAYLNNFYIEGNISFNNGALSPTTGYARNILIGGGRVAANVTLTNNYTYYNSNTCCGVNDIGYEAGVVNFRATGNHFISGADSALKIVKFPAASTVVGNTFYGNIFGFGPPNFPSNTYHLSRPSTTSIFVRRNQYEPGRGHVVVYNWPLSNNVTVNISSLGFAVGESYTIRSVQDYFGATIHGTYTGAPITIPMTNWAVGAPVGMSPPPSSLPEFGVFLISK